MNGITIEVLRAGDIQEYSALMVEVMEEFNRVDINDFQYWFTSVEGISFRRDRDRSDEKIKTVQFAAKYNGKIIGALEFEYYSHIQSFFIKKEFHNKGIGKMMFNNALNFFRKKGIMISDVSVYSSTYATYFYKSLGFEGDDNLLYYSKKMRFKLIDVFFFLGKQFRKLNYSRRRFVDRIKIKQELVAVYN